MYRSPRGSFKMWKSGKVRSHPTFRLTHFPIDKNFSSCLSHKSTGLFRSIPQICGRYFNPIKKTPLSNKSGIALISVDGLKMAKGQKSFDQNVYFCRTNFAKDCNNFPLKQPLVFWLQVNSVKNRSALLTFHVHIPKSFSTIRSLNYMYVCTYIISFFEGTVFEMEWKTHHTPVIAEVGVFQAWFAARNSCSIYLRHFANGEGGGTPVNAGGIHKLRRKDFAYHWPPT